MTFMPQASKDSDALDILQMHSNIIKRFGYSSSDFWDLPLFMVSKLLGAFEDPRSQPISRKQLVDDWRNLNIRFGNV